jgi:hypothetical protein
MIIIGDVDSLRQRVRREQPFIFADFGAMTSKLMLDYGLDGFSLIRALRWAANGGDFQGHEGLKRVLQISIRQEEKKETALLAA